ncbi:MAG TPA: exodeoxyribonuclease VII small subunit [Candidatus Saccharimonadales bacterium]|nr:exodeoxyribonuclease VII small subunit [Candidatus Saccharimonadales bacterium]
MPKKTTGQSYKELSRQLDEVMAKLQDPETAIDDATNYFEQAMELIKQLEKQLEEAENKVREIKTQFTGE